MESILQDVRYGIRALAKKPGFTVIAVIALALGIGANTAIFSVVDAILLRPLAYEDPERLALIWENNTKENNPQQFISYPDFTDFRDQSQSFTSLGAATSRWMFNLTGGAEPEQVPAMYASASLFQLLGVNAAYGRVFVAEDDRTGAEPVVIISDGLWKRQFGAESDVIGRSLSLSGNRATIIGIMPPGFQFLEEVDLWIPLSHNPLINRGRALRFLALGGRLAPGVTLAQARAEMEGLARGLEAQYPDSNKGIGVRLVPMHEQVTGAVRPALLVLLGAVAFLLLIACANVANLMLARATARYKEVAIRSALGAGRFRLIRQFLTEAVLLSAIGGAVGLLLAVWGIDLLLAIAPSDIPRQAEIGIDGKVLGFTLGVSVLTGLLFGLVPAIQASRIDLNEALKEGARGSASGVGSRFRKLLVATEIALALVLLIGSGLLIRSFSRLLEVNPGFVTENVLTMSVLLPQSKYPDARSRTSFYQRLEERISALPGVSSMGGVTRLPLFSPANNNITSEVAIEGRGDAPSERAEVDFRRASSDYFKTLGIPLLAGRLLTDQDASASAPLILINEAMARRLWPDEDPVGKRIRFHSTNPDQNPWMTVVGVVGSVRHLGLASDPRPEFYLHYLTSPLISPIIVVRTTSDPAALIPALRSQVNSIDQDLPISSIRTMDQLVSRSVAGRRFSMLLLTIFAGVALVLAAVGVYGVMSYSVQQRTREIGIRMALGARPRDVLALVVVQGLSIAAIGIATGLAAALVLTSLMRSLLYSVSPTDPLTFALISLLLAGVAIASSYIPARRATRVDPMTALRYE